MAQTSAPVEAFLQEQVVKTAQAKQLHAQELEDALGSYRAALVGLRSAYGAVRDDFNDVSQRELHAAFRMTRQEIEIASAARRRRRPRAPDSASE